LIFGALGCGPRKERKKRKGKRPSKKSLLTTQGKEKEENKFLTGGMFQPHCPQGEGGKRDKDWPLLRKKKKRQAPGGCRPAEKKKKEGR